MTVGDDSSRFASVNQHYDAIIHEEEEIICGWPTDSVTINAHVHDDDSSSNSAMKVDEVQTVLFFIPGNPGCVGWYIRFLANVISKIGPRYAAHGISYAGHGVGDHIVEGLDPKLRDLPWTIKGQVEHKIKWIDEVLTSYCKSVRIIFISHSIGSHMVQRICMLRKDLLRRSDMVFHLMPFIRFEPSILSQRIPLTFMAHLPKWMTVGGLQMACQFAANVPKSVLENYFNTYGGVKCPDGRMFALELVRQPEMARNFLTLGVEELRTLPAGQFDEISLNTIAQNCRTFLLYCGGPDQWAPYSHMKEMREKQDAGILSRDIQTKFMADLVHGFVVFPEMVDPVVSFVVDSILASSHSGITKQSIGHMRSKL
mmetsp:Transcript_23604/g.35434  ORF Transcript_23604/g.35434 Transcript_23604/m.35434 type:complete len:370 (-) Transcript_23604:47-1156(-)|eukprot:CAMPEP_0116030044 /NCGR_PEP_ID=MMETSP0321-20121206/16594_1 /TAXON_ID=163516 /ORGANISM="Leptocylindrus danicus var. danicus, Strain B650" /LENGTH=369 /DNA_ID=CAMNT_0003504723 /DNA_START=214 /DNA_END=1323 /DNA_ORIENTATION=+